MTFQSLDSLFFLPISQRTSFREDDPTVAPAGQFVAPNPPVGIAMPLTPSYTAVGSMKNSVFSWEDIVADIRRGAGLAPDDSMDLALMETIRDLFEFYGIIIPITGEHPSPNDNLGQRAVSYLLPALLGTCEGGELQQLPMLGSSFSRVENRFKFGNFVPPSLVQRIQAKLYFGASNKRKLIMACNMCWKNAFCQLDIGSEGDDGKEEPVYIMVVLESSRNSSVLRVIGFANFIYHRNLLAQLRDYCAVVDTILELYPGLASCEDMTTLCPTCTMASRPGEEIREFSKTALSSASSTTRFVLCEGGHYVPLSRLIFIDGSEEQEPTLSYIEYLHAEIQRLHSVQHIALPVGNIGSERRVCKILLCRKADVSADGRSFGIYPIKAGSGVFVNVFGGLDERLVSEAQRALTPVVLTADHCIRSDLSCPASHDPTVEDDMVYLIGDESTYYFTAEVIYTSGYTQYREGGKSISERTIETSSGGWYDVAALANFKHIRGSYSDSVPASIRQTKGCHVIEYADCPTGYSRPSQFSPVDVSDRGVYLEQSLQLLGFSETRADDAGWLRDKSQRVLTYDSHAVDWGRIVQMNTREEHFMARVYCRGGGSGGPALDTSAKLIGITHATNAGDGVATFFMPFRLIKELRELSKAVNMPRDSEVSLTDDTSARKEHAVKKNFRRWLKSGMT